MIKKEKGFLTLDFIFSLTLSCAVIILFLGLTLTLTVVEIGQYIVFATSRNYAASHFNIARQKQEARIKYQQLLGGQIGSLYGRGWFELSPEPSVGSFISEYGSDMYMPFTGARTQFKAKILNLDFPFLGQALGASKNQVFGTTIASFLIREPTYEECYSFNVQRYESLLRLVESRRAVPGFVPRNGVLSPGDNGC